MSLLSIRKLYVIWWFEVFLTCAKLPPTLENAILQCLPLTFWQSKFSSNHPVMNFFKPSDIFLDCALLSANIFTCFNFILGIHNMGFCLFLCRFFVCFLFVYFPTAWHSLKIPWTEIDHLVVFIFYRCGNWEVGKEIAFPTERFK